MSRSRQYADPRPCAAGIFAPLQGEGNRAAPARIAAAGLSRVAAEARGAGRLVVHDPRRYQTHRTLFT